MSILNKLITNLNDIVRPYESEDTVYNLQNYYGEILFSDYAWKSYYRRKQFGLYEKFVVNSGYVKYFHKYNNRGDVVHYQRNFSYLQLIVFQVSENSFEISRGISENEPAITNAARIAERLQRFASYNY